jgi:NADH-quinone oxidoreductase subunit E
MSNCEQLSANPADTSATATLTPEPSGASNHAAINFSAKFDRVCQVLDKYNRNPHSLIAILQKIQEEYNYLPEEIIIYISTALGISPSRVYGMATFYSHFTLEPKGKYVIKVCNGTACHVRKSQPIIKTLEEELGLTSKKRTTDDMLFTLETVSCLGTCALAPVLTVNDEVYSAMTSIKTSALLKNLRAKESRNEPPA